MHASEMASKRSTGDGFLGRRIGPETEANIRSIGSPPPTVPSPLRLGPWLAVVGALSGVFISSASDDPEIPSWKTRSCNSGTTIGRKSSHVWGQVWGRVSLELLLSLFNSQLRDTIHYYIEARVPRSE
ncbi:putative MutS protein [Fusarium oxysporum f. sp. albedinis]|nr:putative MutS protein [Fusarium oxysporum f. sp. albedinis]